MSTPIDVDVIRKTVASVKAFEKVAEEKDFVNFLSPAKELSENAVKLVRLATENNLLESASQIRETVKNSMAAAKVALKEKTDQSVQNFLELLGEVAKVIVKFAKEIESKYSSTNQSNDDNEELEQEKLQQKKEEEEKQRLLEQQMQEEKLRQEKLKMEEERQRQLALQKEEEERQRQLALQKEEEERQRQLALQKEEEERQRQLALQKEEEERQLQLALQKEEEERQRQLALQKEEEERQRQLALQKEEEERQRQLDLQREEEEKQRLLEQKLMEEERLRQEQLKQDELKQQQQKNDEQKVDSSPSSLEDLIEKGLEFNESAPKQNEKKDESIPQQFRKGSVLISKSNTPTLNGKESIEDQSIPDDLSESDIYRIKKLKFVFASHRPRMKYILNNDK